MKLSVAEVFYSIQGEGITAGIPAVFIRLGGCNLMCGGHGTELDGKLHDDATWRCDSIEVWRKSKAIEHDKILNDDHLKKIRNGAHVIITGGEPLLQEEGILKLIEFIKGAYKTSNVFFEIETNGTITPSARLLDEVDLWNCSPKLKNSGMSISSRLKLVALIELNEVNTQFKFVIKDDNDLQEIFSCYTFLDRDKFIIMPAGDSIEELQITAPIVAEICKNEVLRFTPRLHINIWNKKTGV